MTILDKIARDIRAVDANVFDLVLVQKDQWAQQTLRPVSPCQACYSVTKTFIATGIGMLADRGLLSVDDPVIKFFADELPPQYDEKLPQMTVRHLLTQTCGHEEGFPIENHPEERGQNWLRYTLSLPLKYAPGTQFVYSNATYYLLSCIIHRVTGKTAEAFLREALFAPMDIEHYAWSSCPMGESQGGTGLYLSTADMAKLGVLYRDEGVYNGKRLLSAEWVREATRNHAQTGGPDGYGYGLWVCPSVEGFAFSGAFNQLVVVLPKKDLVFAAHGFLEDCDYFGMLLRAIEE